MKGDTMPSEKSRGGEPTVRANTGRNPERDNLLPYSRKRREVWWGELDTNDIGRFVAKVCDSGRGCILGRTSDGGALSITILDGDKRIREYPTNESDFADLATWCMDNL
jgi:hypothetical protein